MVDLLSLPVGDLIAHHRQLVEAGATDKALAEVEYRVMEAAPEDIPRSGHALLKWASSVLKQSQHMMARRRELWIAGAPADPLWARVDAGMPIGRTARVLRAARGRASRRNREAFRRAIEEELRKMDYRPSPEPAAEAAAPTPILPTAGEAADPFPSLPPLPAPGLAAREFWQRLREVLAEHMRPRLEFMPEHERDRLLDDFDRDVQSLCAQHSSKWKKSARAQQDQQRVSRQRFANALRVLHMDPPRRGASLEPLLAQANKQKKIMARLYHPDSHGGSEHTRAQYQAVLDAFLVVEQYVSENKKPVAPSLRLVDGGKQ